MVQLLTNFKMILDQRRYFSLFFSKAYIFESICDVVKLFPNFKLDAQLTVISELTLSEYILGQTLFERNTSPLITVIQNPIPPDFSDCI